MVTTLKPPAAPKTGVYLGARTVPTYPQQSLPEGNLPATVYSREALLGCKLRLVTTFRDWNHLDYNVEQELIVDGGRIPQITLSAGWPGDAFVVAGQFDAQLKAQGAALGKLKGPFLLRPNHEMNGQPGHTANPTDFVLAWQRMWSFIKPLAPQCKFVWNVMRRGDTSGHHWEDFYPGNHFVGNISIDAYNKNKMNSYLADLLHTGDYNLPSQNRDWYAIFSDPIYNNRELMISETGCREASDPSNEQTSMFSKAMWVDRVIPDLKTMPKVRWVAMWDSYNNGHDWRWDTTNTPLVTNPNLETFQAFKRLVNDPYCNPLK